MGHTPEQRERHDLCNAMTKRGVPCRAFAGQGTDHPGFGRCKFHLGNAPNQKKQAAKLEAAKRMITLGAPIDGLQPHQALLALMRATAGHVAFLNQQIGALDGDFTAQEPQVLISMYSEERDRLARIGEACLRAGIAAEEIRLRQEELVILGQALTNACDAAGFSEEQKRTLGQALRAELAAHEGRDAAPESIFAAAAA